MALTDRNLPTLEPPTGRSAGALWPYREMEVTVLYGPDVYEPGPHGNGGRRYDWELPLLVLEQRARLAGLDWLWHDST